MAYIPENLQQIVMNQFTRVAQNDRCTFLGNVNLGSSVSLKELRDLYHVVSFEVILRFRLTETSKLLAYIIFEVCFGMVLPDLVEQVVLAYGAESDRVLGIPGEVILGEGILKYGCIQQFYNIIWYCYYQLEYENTFLLSRAYLSHLFVYDFFSHAFFRIWKAYTQRESLFGGIMGIQIAGTCLLTWKVQIQLLFLVRYILEVES